MKFILVLCLPVLKFLRSMEISNYGFLLYGGHGEAKDIVYLGGGFPIIVV